MYYDDYTMMIRVWSILSDFLYDKNIGNMQICETPTRISASHLKSDLCRTNDLIFSVKCEWDNTTCLNVNFIGKVFTNGKDFSFEPVRIGGYCVHLKTVKIGRVNLTIRGICEWEDE